MRISPLFLLLPLAVGCPKSGYDAGGRAAADNPHKLIQEFAMDDGMVRQEVDLDGDGTPEVINYQRPRPNGAPLILRKETDLNRDGIIDVRSFFTEAGRLEREEMDGDFDGVFDWVDHYQDGIRVMSESDTDFDGNTNVWSYYEGQTITRQERDTDGNGMIDYWIRYDDQGNAVRTARDLDGDGKMDVRDQ